MAILKLFLYLWIALAIFNVCYNAQKTITEIREWSSLTDSEKRHKIFGDLYTFFIMVKDHSGNHDEILLFSTDQKTHFLGTYYLYPRRLTDTENKKYFNELIETKKFTYVAAYNLPVISTDYERIATFSSKVTTNYGSIYKLK